MVQGRDRAWACARRRWTPPSAPTPCCRTTAWSFRTRPGTPGSRQSSGHRRGRTSASTPGVLLKSADGLPLGTLCVLDYPRPPRRPDAAADRDARRSRPPGHGQLELRRAIRRSATDGRSSAVPWPTARPSSAPSPTPCPRWSGRPCRTASTTTTTPAGTSSPACRPARPTARAGTTCSIPTIRSAPGSVWQHSLATGDLYEIEYRLRHHDGVYRWTLGRATPIRNEAGEITRWFGTCTDIDDLKRCEQGKDLLSQELSHRIKNIFAVVSALIALSAREYPEAKAFAGSVRDRINALARAHEFVRPHSEVSQPTVGDTTLHAFLSALFKPYVDAERPAARADRRATTPPSTTRPRPRWPCCSTSWRPTRPNTAPCPIPDGRGAVAHRATTGDRFILTWTEQGGPPIAGKPVTQGFGSALATLSVEGQLGGKLERRWEPGGLIVEADLPATALSRRRAASRIRNEPDVTPIRR